MNSKKTKKKPLLVIISIVFLNSVGMTIVFPLLPFLVGKYLPESQVVVGMSTLVSVFAACTFIAAPVFGALSDQYGRKKILTISLTGSAVGYVLFGIGGALWVLFLGRIIDGLTAGNISTLFAYIADTTEPDERTKCFGYIGAASGFGFMIGPAFGGWLGTVSLSLPFFVTAGLILLSALCTLIFLPESLAQEKRTGQLLFKNMNTLVHIKDMLSVQEVKRLLILGAFFAIGLGIYQYNISVFLKDIFRWGPALVGSILALIGICDVVSRSLLLPFMLKKNSERTMGIIGLIGIASGLALIFISAYIPQNWMIAVSVVLIAFGEGLFDPSFNSNLSKAVDDNRQGKLQGVNQALQSVYRVLVPLGAAVVYLISPAMLYLIAALVALGALWLFSLLTPRPAVS